MHFQRYIFSKCIFKIDWKIDSMILHEAILIEENLDYLLRRIIKKDTIKRSSIACLRGLLFETAQKNVIYTLTRCPESLSRGIVARKRNVRCQVSRGCCNWRDHTLHATHTGPVRGSSWTEYKSRVFHGAPCDFSLSPT